MSESEKNIAGQIPDAEGISKKILPRQVLKLIEEAKKSGEPTESQLIAVLHAVQEHFGFLSPETMDAVAYLMGIAAAKVSGVATFYHYFRFTPSGKFVISVCMGTACYVKGGEEVLNKFRHELGIEVKETTNDGVFSLEEARCLGTCALAPVVKIGNDVHSQVTPDQVPALIERYIKLSKETA
jgi:NADH:ubiquinone oxidoreductase subunit E